MYKSNQSADVVTNIDRFGQINMPYGCSIRDDGTIIKLSVTSSLAYSTCVVSNAVSSLVCKYCM